MLQCYLTYFLFYSILLSNRQSNPNYCNIIQFHIPQGDSNFLAVVLSYIRGPRCQVSTSLGEFIELIYILQDFTHTTTPKDARNIFPEKRTKNLSKVVEFIYFSLYFGF